MGDELTQAAQYVVQLKTAVTAAKVDVGAAKELLSKLKRCLTTFESLPGGAGVAQGIATQQLLCARETFELAAQLDINTRDMESFERHVSQVKTFYFDYSSVLPESPFMLQMLGLNLLCLLAQNRIADFHTELELLPIEQHDNLYIKFPVQLEQYLMEGSYNKILSARTDVPAASYTWFIEILTTTVRDAIADCSESAYSSLKLDAAKRMFLFDTQEQVVEYAGTRGWETDAAKGVVNFKEESGTNLEIPSMRVIKEMLSYAKELERIV